MEKTEDRVKKIRDPQKWQIRRTKRKEIEERLRSPQRCVKQYQKF